MSRFTIHGNHYEFSALFPEPKDTSPPGTIPPTRYLLIQTKPDQPLTKAQYGELGQLGLTVQEYLGRDVYLLHWPHPTSGLQSPADPLVELRNAGFEASFYHKKIDPSVVSKEGVEKKHVRRDNSIRVCVSLHRKRDRSTTEIIDDLKLKLTRLYPRQYQPISDALDSIARTKQSAAPIKGISNDLILVSVKQELLGEWPVELLREWGTVDEVCAISEIHPPQPCCTQSRAILGVNNIAQLPGVAEAGLGYAGEGQTVAVFDTGFDCGTTELENLHRAFARKIEIDPNAVTLLRPLGAEELDADALAEQFRDGGLPNDEGHGTLVCGCVCGNDDRDIQNNLVSGGVRFRDLKGVAPGARLIVQKDWHWYGLEPMSVLYTRPFLVGTGAYIHNSSLTSPEENYLPAAGGLVDDTVWENRGLLTIFAAGNNGVYRDQYITSPIVRGSALSKNGLTIGATQVQGVGSVRLGMSSYGTSLNGRIKPELVAPGQQIWSVKSRAIPAHGDPPGGSYHAYSGTSFAAPLVSGCAAVIRGVLFQCLPLRYNANNPPPAALMKAFLINAAIPLPSEPGEVEQTRRTGFGRVDLEGSVQHILDATNDENAGSGFQARADMNADNIPNHADVVTITVPAHNHPRTLTVTLVYTDASGGALQHNINLVATHTSPADVISEHHGNRGLQPVNGGVYDNVNNSERIIWSPIPPGEVKIKLRLDGIAHHTEGFPDYAVVWHLTEPLPEP